MSLVCSRWFMNRLSAFLPAVFLFAVFTGGIWSARAAEKAASNSLAGHAVPGRALILATANGQNRWQLPVRGNRDAWIVAVSRTSGHDDPDEVRLRARMTASQPRQGAYGSTIAFDSPGKDAGVVKTGHRVSRPVFQGPQKPPQEAAAERVFQVQTGDGSSDDLAQYEVVRGGLVGSGKTVNVYLDKAENAAGKQKLAAEVVRIMDEEIPAAVIPRIGAAADIDGDGRIAVILTPALSRMADGRLAIDGFVRPTDFDPAGSLPRSHASDVIFINSRVNDTGYLKSLLAHEYTHAVAATARLAMAAQAGSEIEEEESWLEEGLAHLSERWVDGSWANLNYRISAYYESPESNRLIVNDQAGLGSGRSHGHRGAAYLFLKWCEETYGSDLPRRLIESQTTGRRNLEEATGVGFEKLFRAWTVQLMGEIAGQGAIESLREKALLDDWLAGAPRDTRLEAGSGLEEIAWRPAATATRFFRISAESGLADLGHIEVELSGAEAGAYQVTALPLRDHHMGFDVRVLAENESGSDGATMRLLIQNRDPHQGLTLQSAAWENTAARTESEWNQAQRGLFDILMIARMFGGYKIGPGKSILTPPLVIPARRGTPGGKIQWKLVAHDESGRPVFSRAVEESGGKVAPERIATGESPGNTRVR